MAEHTELVVHVIAGEPRLGLWCDRCSTSAGYEVTVYLMRDDSLDAMPCKTISRCDRCDDDDAD